MFAYSLRRIVQAVPILLIATMIVFFAVSLGSPDPVASLAASCPTCDESAYQRLIDLYELDKSIPERYVAWLSDVVTGDLGISTQGERPVHEVFWDRFGNTMLLAIPSFILMALLALLLSIYQALRQYSAGDYLATGISYFGLSMPPFFFGLLLQAVVIAVNKKWGVKPLWTQGMHTGSAGQVLASFTLPAITLILVYVASESRFGRTAMLEIKNSDYIRTARAKGLSERKVVFRHMLRNAMVPLVTLWALDFSLFLGGTVVIESVFSWPGLGRLLLVSIRTRDLDVVMAIVTALAIVVVLFNLLADLLYGILDPRIRLN